MWYGFRLLIFMEVALSIGPFVDAKKYNITLGYLPCIKGHYLNDPIREGPAISGAISLALEEINNATELLPDVDLLLEWHDTQCNTKIASRLITEMSSSGVVAFFGPEKRCEAEALIAQSQNLPMITYKCSDYQTSLLPNFARLSPLDTQAMTYVISLLRYYRWNKFSILYDESWTTASSTLENYARENNMTVNCQLRIRDVYKCCEEMLECCAPNYLDRFIRETKNRTRIYVLLGSQNSLTDIMTAMELQHLFDHGQYMVIFVDMMAYSPKTSMKYLINTSDRVKHTMCPDTPVFYKRAQSLLVVVSSAQESYDGFMRAVRDYNALEPFKFTTPSIFEKKFNKFVPIYAAYLYDSVKLYATALHSLIEEDTRQRNETLTYQKLMSITTNGSRIVSRMITNTPFKSVSGMSIRLDERADSEGNFSVLAFKPVNFTDDDINCTYSMIPVGHFQQSTKKYPEYKLNPRLPIDWPDSVKPEDEPSCGFLNEKCPKGDSQITTFAVAGTLAVMLIFAFLCLLFIVKRVKTRRYIAKKTGRTFISSEVIHHRINQ